MVHKSQTPSPELIARAYSWRLEVVAPEHEHRRHLSRDERTLLRDSTSSIDPWRFRLQTRRRDARLHELCARQQKQAYELIRSCLQYYTPIKIVVKSFFLDRNSRYQLTIPPHTTGIDTISDACPAPIVPTVPAPPTLPIVPTMPAVPTGPSKATRPTRLLGNLLRGSHITQHVPTPKLESCATPPKLESCATPPKLQYKYSYYTFSPYLVTEIFKLLEISTTAANILVGEMTGLGILKEITGFSRNRIFVLHEYLELFTR